MTVVSTWFAILIVSFTTLGCMNGFQPAVKATATGIGGTTGGGTTTAPVTAPRVGLLDNVGFESELTGWEDWGMSALISTGTHSGTRALRITGTGGRGQEVIYRLKTGGTYRLKAFGRVASQTDVVYLGVKYFDQGNAQLGDERVRVTTTAYSEYTVTFKLPVSVSSAKIYAYKETDTATPADFDDFSLVLVGNPTNPPMQPAIANPTGLQPSVGTSGWTLVFNDEFTDAALSALWNVGFWFNYTINNELQAYRPENVRTGTGTLNLLAEKRATTTTWGEAMGYASGAVTTRGKFAFTFGVAEARLRVPRGRGFYPQFWLLPSNKRSPPEIDVLQVVGNDPGVARFNYNWMDENGIPHAQPMTAAKGDLSTAYHTYSVQWLPDSVTYYVDGAVVGSYQGEFVLRDPAYLLLNLAVGGDVPGAPDGATTFPQGLEIDYVRVWQKPL